MQGGSPCPVHGYDGAKRAKGRKRHLLLDTLGLVLLAHGHAADLQDHRAGARARLGIAVNLEKWPKSR